jgi:hypothetical protein
MIRLQSDALLERLVGVNRLGRVMSAVGPFNAQDGPYELGRSRGTSREINQGAVDGDHV